VTARTGIWTRAEIDAARIAAAENYHEFVVVPAMSAGTYALRAGEPDLQRPHSEDEIYHVLGGHGRIEMDGVDHPVGPGDTVFVGVGVVHRFHSITEDLTLLVVFAPAHSG
jgi:mannose-6-phosphate isomerase-like protein (cupin superfamily)